MSGTNINAICDAVRNGGSKVVIAANTGEYSPEFPTDQFVLLKKLGIDPPQGRYVTSDANVKATAAGKDNPLFTAGDNLRFYSLADLKNDLDSDPVKKNYDGFPYRYLPQTNYFGYYPDNQEKNGTVLATFPNGSPAVSTYKCGAGEGSRLLGPARLQARQSARLHGQGGALGRRGHKRFHQSPAVHARRIEHGRGTPLRVNL